MEEDDDQFINEVNEEFNANVEQNDVNALKTSAVWAHQDLAQVKIKVFRGHTGAVISCQFCDNDQKILTASHDLRIILWDAWGNQSLQVYQGQHDLEIAEARATNDCKRFVSCGWDKKVNLWDTETGQVMWCGRHDDLATCCNISVDGSIIVSGSDVESLLRLWDMRSGNIIRNVEGQHTSTITSCSLTSTSDRIVSTSMDKTAKVYDLRSSVNTITLQGHINIVTDAALTPNDHQLVTVSYDRSIRIWDISSGQYRSQGPAIVNKAHAGCLSSCDISHDGRVVVTGGYDQIVSVWDAENCIQKLMLSGHEDFVEDVSLSQNRKWIASCSRDKTVRLWNIEKADQIPMTLAKQKAKGLKVFKCSQCGKPFSTAQLELAEDTRQCFFCRLKTPDRHSAFANLPQ